MDRYLFTARSVTHARQMAEALGRGGIHVRIRRVSGAEALRGCGYTLEVSERQYTDALQLLRGEKLRPVRIYAVSGGKMREVGL